MNYGYFYRLVVLRTERGDTVIRLLQPLVRTGIVPTIEPDGTFGRIEYHWDGKETNVQGYPVYR